MCDSAPTSATRPRPRWRRLYAIVLLAVTAFALAGLSVQAPALRVALECAIAAAAWGATLAWTRANRVALDLLEWCDCAAKTITIRVISSRPARATDRDAAGAVVVPVGGPRDRERDTPEPTVTIPR